MLGLLALVLFGAGFAAFLLFADRSGMIDDEEEVTADGASDDADPEGDGDSTTDGAEGATDASTTGDDPTAEDDNGNEAGADDEGAGTGDGDQRAVPDGPFVEATLDLDKAGGPGMFVLNGRVPDEQTADAVIQAAELSYAPFVESNLEVDDSLEPAPWLAAAPNVIGLLPSVTDGTIRVVDGTIELDARSPNPQYLATLQGALEQLTGGMPVEMVGSEITDLQPPLFVADVDDGEIALSGYVPSEEIRALLEGAAAAAYGPENVTNELTIDDSTYTSFWMYTMPGIFQLFTFFPTYNIRVEDGATSGSLQGGVHFAVDSAEISPEAAERLNLGVAVMARDISLFMTVEGHTDSDGPDEYNQALSLARAESVTAYFEAAGIDPARLQPIGAGESEPIAPNDTGEGKALNRRVEFMFGPPPSG